MAFVFELWRRISVTDETHSTWELVGRFHNAKLARQTIHELAGSHVVSPDEETFWYEDAEGEHRFRIEAVQSES
jgi:hypothetical protein